MEVSNNSLASSAHLRAEILDTVLYSRLSITVVVISITLVVFGITKLSVPTLDPKEPPLLKARIPVIGHIIGRFCSWQLWWYTLILDGSGLIRHQVSYHNMLRSANSRNV